MPTFENVNNPWHCRKDYIHSATDSQRIKIKTEPKLAATTKNQVCLHSIPSSHIQPFLNPSPPPSHSKQLNRQSTERKSAQKHLIIYLIFVRFVRLGKYYYYSAIPCQLNSNVVCVCVCIATPHCVTGILPLFPLKRKKSETRTDKRRLTLRFYWQMHAFRWVESLHTQT